MKDIFTPEKKSKRNKDKFPLLHSTEKEREVKNLDDRFKKRYNKDYIERLTTLLYNSKNKKDYSKKRKNLTKAVYKLDENEKLYLTLPKLNEGNNNNNGFANRQGNVIGTNYNGIKTQTTGYTNTNINTNPTTKKRFLSTEKESKEKEPLNENITEIFYDPDFIDEKEEEKAKFLYEKLKTKYHSFDLGDEHYKKKNGRKNLSKIKTRNIPPDYQLIATPKQISEFDYNLGQAFIKGNFRFLTNKQKENLGYIGELNLFNSINRLKHKQNKIKELKNEKKGKNILLPIDLFKYDAEKWKKYTYEKNKNNNDVVINELNEKNKIKLDDMKEYIDKLNNEAYNADKDVNNIINKIDIFLEKYGNDSGITMTRKNSRVSDYSIKSIRNSLKKKEKEKENKSNYNKDDDNKEDLKLSLEQSQI